MGILKRYKMHLVFSVFVAIVLILSSIQLEVPTDDANDSLISNFPILRIGTVEAAGTVDYTVDGTDDNVQFQAALDALPATGGRIQALSGTYNFSATVSRAIDNVLIEGTGQATIFNNDAATALFSAGSQANWTFRDFSTDAGGLTVSSATYWTMQDITIGASYYAFRTSEDITASDWDIPTGRTPTCVVAASDAPDPVKAQSDVVCDGIADEVEINAYLALAAGGKVLLTEGTFNIAGGIIVPSGTTLEGIGWGTKIYRTTSATGATLAEDLDAVETGIDVSDGTKFIAGQTIKIDTEQFFITAITGDTLTVNTRPHNGTTAATHTSGTAITFEGAVIRNANTMGLVAEVSNIKVRNLWVDAGSDVVTQTSSTGIEIRKCDNSLAEGCWVQNTKGGHPTGADMDTMRGIGIALDDSDGCVVRGNYVTDTSHGAISVRNNCHNILVLGNYTFLSDWEGIVVCNKTFSDSSATGEECSDIVITGNHVWDCGQAGASYGIYVEDQATTGDGNPHKRVTISDNTISFKSTGTMSGIAIRRQPTTTLAELDCVIDNNTIYGVTEFGIRLYYAPAVIVSNNNIRGCGGINISIYNSHYANVTGNDTMESGSYGIDILNSTECSISNNIVKDPVGVGIYVEGTSPDVEISGNRVDVPDNKQGIYVGGTDSVRANVHNNKIFTTGDSGNGHGITIGSSNHGAMVAYNRIVNLNDSGSPTTKGIQIAANDCILNDNKILCTSPVNGYYYAVRMENGTSGNVTDGNTVTNGYRNAAYYDTGTGNVVQNNTGYIAPGEIRTYSGSLSAGANGDIGFSWHNPVPQDCYIKRVVVSVNSAAAAAATGRVGIADDATGTNLGAEFFTAIPLNSTGVYDSYVSGDTGAQTKWIAVQDSASATDGWVCLKIETNDSTATGTYYIEYVGK